MKTILLTGGAGYVGSHCAKSFARDGWYVVCIDNLSRGWRDAVRWGPLIEADISDRSAVAAAIERYRPDVIAHFAAYAYVGESVSTPELYYDNNVGRTFAFLETIRSIRPIPFLFSSTCATFGHPRQDTIDEDHPQWPINSYGWSKLIIERMLADYAIAHALPSVALRYFNAAGGDPDGEIGERHEPETHVIPLAIDAALAHDRTFSVFGTDFDTRDGSAVRDYIHVMDLADAHVRAAHRLLSMPGQAEVYNLGTGHGTSVLELVAAIRRVTGRPLPIELSPRRPGDPAMLVAKADKARRILGWAPQLSAIDTIIDHALIWRRIAR